MYIKYLLHSTQKVSFLSVSIQIKYNVPRSARSGLSSSTLCLNTLFDIIIMSYIISYNYTLITSYKKAPLNNENVY